MSPLTLSSLLPTTRILFLNSVQNDHDREEETTKELKPDIDVHVPANEKKTDIHSKRLGASCRQTEPKTNTDQQDNNKDVLIGRKREGETDEEYLSRVIIVDGEIFDLVDNTYEVR